MRALLAAMLIGSVPHGLVHSWATVAQPPGTSVRERWTFAIYADGKFSFAIGNTLFFDDGQATVNGNKITLVERIARGEKCHGSSRTGTYLWQVAGTKLTLTASADGCAWRRAILTTEPLTRMAG